MSALTRVLSPAWREFRLWQFDLFVKTFQGGSDQPQIALMFNNVEPDGEETTEGKHGGKGEGKGEGGFTEEWKWVTANAKGGVGVKIAGSGRGHHLSGERTKIDAWQPLLIAAQGTPLFARSEMDQTWQKAMYFVNRPLNFYWGALTGLQNGQSIWDVSAGAMEACKEQGFDYSFYFAMPGKLTRRQPPIHSALYTKGWMLPIPRLTPRPSSDRPNGRMWIAC
jgi:hypothetical protein